jgi:hypothetical protein
MRAINTDQVCAAKDCVKVDHLEAWLSTLKIRLLRLVGRSVRLARDGVILKSTTNKGGLLWCRRAYNGDNDDYHKGIVGGAVPAQSMTRVIEGKAVFTQGKRRWHLVKGAVCQDVIEEATPSTTRKGPSGTISQSCRLLPILSSLIY